MQRILSALVIILLIISCKQKQNDPYSDFNRLAERYVRLALFTGQYDGAFVDAYYGPDSLKPSGARPLVFPKDSLLKEVDILLSECRKYADPSFDNDTIRARAGWMSKQLNAFSRRIRWFAGEEANFDEEAKDLFGVQPPSYPEAHYRQLVDSLDKLLPGEGPVQERVQKLSAAFIIPPARVDTVFKAAYLEARKRAKEKLQLPAGESFRFEYVHDKPWSGYNWYKGNYTSLIQQNLDLPIAIERAIDLACHEGYPGHHVYNMLLEKNLYHDKGWVEISLYPLYSPQSLIAEGSANYGIELAFPGEEKISFAKEVLFPLAGLDTAGATAYFEMLAIKEQLNYARNEAARGLLNKTMSEEQAIKWMMDYMLVSKEQATKYISFIQANHSYVICYNYGKDLIGNYIDRKGGDKWKAFEYLLSNPVTIDELLNR